MDPIVVFLGVGIIGAWIARGNPKVSLADLAQSTLVLIPALIVGLYAALFLGTTSIAALAGTGWLGSLITSLGLFGTILGPVFLSFFWGIAMFVMAVVTYAVMKAIKP